MEQLSIAGASAAAPILDCPSPEPTEAAPSGGTGPVVTLPPTDLGASAARPGDAASWLPMLLVLVATIAGGAVATARLRARC